MQNHHNAERPNHSLEIEVLGERKGSNPGGECFLPIPGCSGRYYVKYCNRTDAYGTNFTAANQPIYEAVTAEMAKRLGLNIPSFFVLLNEGNDVSFKNPPGFKKPIEKHRKCYFISKMSPLCMDGDPAEISRLMEGEKIYRELLQLADIEGKRNNFAFVEQYGAKKIVYLDVGCSFVHTHEGVIRLPNRSKRNLALLDRKHVKKALDKLERWHVILKDNTSMMSLKEISTMPLIIDLPIINPRSPKCQERRMLSSLVSNEELDDMVGILALDMADELHKYRQSPLIISDAG